MWKRSGSEQIQFFPACSFFLTHVKEKKENNNDDDDDDNDKQNISRTEECTLSARGAKRDWRERIEATCYAGEPNRAGRVLETERRSILFFSHPSLRVAACPRSATRGMLGPRVYTTNAFLFSFSPTVRWYWMPRQRDTWTRSVLNFGCLTHLHSTFRTSVFFPVRSVAERWTSVLEDERPRSRACNYCNSWQRNAACFLFREVMSIVRFPCLRISRWRN